MMLKYCVLFKGENISQISCHGHHPILPNLDEILVNQDPLLYTTVHVFFLHCSIFYMDVGWGAEASIVYTLLPLKAIWNLYY